MKNVLIVLSFLLLSSGAFAATRICKSSGNTSLPIKVQVKTSLLGNIKDINVEYKKNGRKVQEVFMCKKTELSHVCVAPKSSLVGRVLFHNAFGPGYTVKSEGELANWLECEIVSLFF